MTTIRSIAAFLEEFAPLALAEDWDNVGLLVGDPEAAVTKVMTCLTITADVVAEAIAEHVDLIVSHHPLPFRPLKRLTTETMPGRLVWELAKAGIAVYSPHTAFDSAREGINRRLIDILGAQNIRPLVPHEASTGSDSDEPPGSGRCGDLKPPLPLADIVSRLKASLGFAHAKVVCPRESPIRRVAVACGAAGTFLSAAVDAECDLLVLGETNFHTCLEAEYENITLVLIGHYASERFAVEQLADVLGKAFPEVSVQASRREHDPCTWM
ncbi:MAG: Nif3-like dinuclear metal center hexameric protein [Planctomycetota bacterium]|nr:MAG: Nif3-like dinuclear metal center hexameric protein [Planctomycetota bacterium]